MFKKPKKLERGSKIAVVSPSWGGPGSFPHRYEAGKRQIEEVFGFEIVEMPNTLKSAEFIYKNPKARADDIMEAFYRKDIDGVFASIGGQETIRVAPFIDLDIIKENPKVFLGYSDTTIIHYLCYKANLVSFYGPSVMSGFAENGGIPKYLIQNFNRVICDSQNLNTIEPNKNGYIIDAPSWNDPKNQNISAKINVKNTYIGNRVINGSGIVEGHLIGGAIESLESLKGTSLFPSIEKWRGGIFFIDISEEMQDINLFKRMFRHYGVLGILQELSGIMVGKTMGLKEMQDKYEKAILDVIIEELSLKDLVIFSNMDFGHIRPIFTIPYGVKARLNTENASFSIIENSVIN